MDVTQAEEFAGIYCPDQAAPTFKLPRSRFTRRAAERWMERHGLARPNWSLRESLIRKVDAAHKAGTVPEWTPEELRELELHTGQKFDATDG